MELTYYIVDVFAEQQFMGNQLAVFIDPPSNIRQQTMQDIAREMNYSETTFLFPPEKSPDADVKVRIFTPANELPFAGHPTLGSAYIKAIIMQEAGVKLEEPEHTIILEENIGNIPVRMEISNGVIEILEMTQQEPKFGPIFDDRLAIAETLGIDEEEILPLPMEVGDTGLQTLYVPLRSLKALQSVSPNPALFEKNLGDFCTQVVMIFTTDTQESNITVRSRLFAPTLGVSEDPATGSASGPLGCYLVRHGMVSTAERIVRIISRQGVEIKRPSLIQINIDVKAGKIIGVKVGGKVVHIAKGILTIPEKSP